MRKGNIPAMVISYILMALLVGVLIFFGIDSARTVSSHQEKVGTEQFVVTLSKGITTQQIREPGSLTALPLAVPPSVNEVCFVDTSTYFSPHTVPLLSQQREAYNQSNLFFIPDSVPPATLPSFTLDNASNPLCLTAIGGTVSLQLITGENKTIIRPATPAQRQETCSIVPGSSMGDPAEKIDLIFLGSGYTDKTAFTDAVTLYTQTLFSVEPFASNQQKFNVWMISDKEPPCEISSYVSCSSISVNRIVSRCPHDYMFVLVAPELLSWNTRSSALPALRLASISTKDNPLVLLHEFGHSFGGLAEEYVDEFAAKNFELGKYPNCDESACSIWSEHPDTDCVKGCSANEYYRSVQVGIMRNYDKSGSYGSWNEYTLNQKLERYP